jgi:outer membrane lipoprotein-sorting protein
VLEKYVQALGGAEALGKNTSRLEKGNITTANGRQFPLEVFAKAPDKRLSNMRLPNGDNITAFDGHGGWLSGGGRPARDMTSAEAELFRVDAVFHLATDMKKVFSQVRVARTEKIGDRNTYLVFARNQGQLPVRFWFDQESGLLVRALRLSDTPLGRNPTQVDFADYRDSGGGEKVPYRWTVSRPGVGFAIQLDQVQNNAPIDDAKFAKPAAPPPAAQPKPPAK